MKIVKSTNSIEKLKVKQPSFEGIKGGYDTQGAPVYKITAPSYDNNKYKISLEVVKIAQENGAWKVVRGTGGKETIDVNEIFSKGGVYEYTQERIDDEKTGNTTGKGHLDAIGYRFKLTPIDKDGKVIEKDEVKYMADPGTKAQGGGGEYSVVLKNMGSASIGGPGYHAFADSLVYNSTGRPKEGFESRTHFNQSGAKISDFTSLIKDKKLDPYRWIMTTPLIGQDNVSSHGYWPNNTYQISSRYGSIEGFKDFQVALFNEGKGHVNDGAFTSQVINGFQMQDVLRWGKKSPFYNWFKINGKPALGVLPNEVKSDNPTSKKALDNIRFRLVNAPEEPGFDARKPTYIQLYDSRLVSPEQLKRTGELIKSYDHDSEDHYEIKEHDDSVQPFYFQLDRANDATKIEQLKQAIITSKNAPLSQMPALNELLDFNNFSIVRKGEAGGANFWDGNVDLVKMNLSMPSSKEGDIGLEKDSGFDDTVRERIGLAQARNSLYGLATFWTKTTSNAILEDLVKKAHNPAQLETVAGNFKVPKETLDAVLESVEKGTYKTKLANKEMDTNEFLEEEIINFPLESIGFGADLSALLSSSYITPRPYKVEHANMSKANFLADSFVDEKGVSTGKDYSEYVKGIDEIKGDKYAADVEDILKVNNSAKTLYKTAMKNFVLETLEKVQEEMLMAGSGKLAASLEASAGSLTDEEMEGFYNQKLIFNNKQLTDYGKYVAKLLVPDIIRYGAIKGLLPKENIEFDEKNLPKYKGLQDVGLSSLGIELSDPKSEAEVLIGKMKQAFDPGKEKRNQMTAELAENFAQRIKGTDLKSFEKAEAVLEQTGGGLNWRFDAAKDVADLDSRRSAAIYDKNGKFQGWKDNATFEKCWDDVIDIWKNFIQNAQQQNRSTYTIAEVTDLWSFFGEDTNKANPYLTLKECGKEGNYWSDEAIKERIPFMEHDFGKYFDKEKPSNGGPAKAERMLREIAGATTGSDYGSFFGNIPQMVGQNFEKGIHWGQADWHNSSNYIMGIMNWDMDRMQVENFFDSGTASFINNAHVFVDNHDKPRALHCLALDMNLYLTSFADFEDKEGLKSFNKAPYGAEKSKEYQDIATRVTGIDYKDPNQIKDFKDISPEAVAVGDVFMKTFDKMLEKESKGAELSEEELKGVKHSINQAVRDLALGKFKDQQNKDFRRAKAFGGKDFEISLKDVIEQAKYIAKDDKSTLNILTTKGNYYAKEARYQILKYPKERMLQMWQFMQGLPGAPTLYAGDEHGMTGHEDPSKNNKVNNREPIPFYKLKEKGHDEDVRFYEQMHAVSSLSKIEGMSAIASGTAMPLPQGKDNMYAIYHYDDKGSEVIAVYAGTEKENLADHSQPYIDTRSKAEKKAGVPAKSDPVNDPMGNRGVHTGVNEIVIPLNNLKGGFDQNSIFKIKEFKGNTYVDRDEEFAVQRSSKKVKVDVQDENGEVKKDADGKVIQKEVDEVVYALKKLDPKTKGMPVAKRGFVDSFNLNPLTTFFYREQKKDGTPWNSYAKPVG